MANAEITATPYPAKSEQGGSRRRSKWTQDRREQAIVGYLFVLPDFLGILIFIVLPMLMAFAVSFSNWKLTGTVDFVGFRNFEAIFRDTRFTASLGRSVLYAVGFVPTVYCLSLGMAVLLTRKSRGNTFFRTLYFMPIAMSLVVAGVIWRFMMEPNNGLINMILETLGLPTSEWIGSRHSAMLSVIIVSVWKSAGYFMIILLAGIQDIPSDYLEAAQIDGANRWQTFRFIIMPLLKPTSFFVLVVLTIGALQAFDQIYVMTNGGPAQSTYTLVMYLYDKAFREWNFGYAAAMSVILFGIIFVLTLIQVRYFRSGEIKQ